MCVYKVCLFVLCGSRDSDSTGSQHSSVSASVRIGLRVVADRIGELRSTSKVVPEIFLHLQKLTQNTASLCNKAKTKLQDPDTRSHSFSGILIALADITSRGVA